MVESIHKVAIVPTIGDVVLHWLIDLRRRHAARDRDSARKAGSVTTMG
jgi:hypothetical protein